jgi:signal transduction histidine kinase
MERRGPRSENAARSEISVLNARIARLEHDLEGAENFAAFAAHELLTTLVLTEAFVAMATDHLAGEEFADLLGGVEAVGRSATRTRHVVEALLHAARTTNRPVRRDLVDLHRVANDCIGSLSSEIASCQARIAIARLPAVHGEAELLAGVFTNLLVNALKFSPRAGSTVEVGAAQHNGSWTIFVESEGPSIPPEDRKLIFEPFYRGRRARHVKGAGLGLAICRRLVELHGGTIGVDPVNGDRNRFYFTLPA